MWELVQSRIRESNASSSFSVWKSFSELRQYGQVETRIHAFDLIDAREFGWIAGLKTADVRIARALIWSYLHHFIAGLRHVWMDATHSVSLAFGRQSAAFTLGSSLILTIALGLKLFFF